MFDLQYLTVTAAVLAVAELVGVLLAVDAVMRRRSSQGAIAWCVALVAMPIVVIPVVPRLRPQLDSRGYAEALREAEASVGDRLVGLARTACRRWRPEPRERPEYGRDRGAAAHGHPFHARQPGHAARGRGGNVRGDDRGNRRGRVVRAGPVLHRAGRPSAAARCVTH